MSQPSASFRSLLRQSDALPRFNPQAFRLAPAHQYFAKRAPPGCVTQSGLLIFRASILGLCTRQRSAIAKPSCRRRAAKPMKQHRVSSNRRGSRSNGYPGTIKRTRPRRRYRAALLTRRRARNTWGPAQVQTRLHPPRQARCSIGGTSYALCPAPALRWTPGGRPKPAVRPIPGDHESVRNQLDPSTRRMEYGRE